MISCFSENLVPLVNSSVGVSRVLVTGIFFEEGRGVAHSLQYLESEGLTVFCEGSVKSNIDLSSCNEYVTDFAKKRPITATGA
jgi:hypothetical protein